MQSRNAWFILIVVLLAAASIFGYQNTKLVKGLDVAGGVRLVYEIDDSDLKPEQRQNMTEVQARLRRILENRVSAALGVVEGTVSTKGEDQFVIEIPGATDLQEARNILSNTAKIQVFHAANVSTAGRSRLYTEAGTNSDGPSPFVEFARASDPSKTFAPKSADYERMLKGWKLILEGEDIVDATVRVDGTRTQPDFRFGGKGAENLERFTRQNLNRGEKIAFVLDGTVLSIAPIQDGAILRDQAFIDGDFDPAYVRTLTELIKSGSLPVKLNELSSQSLSPTIGQKAFDQMIVAGFISLGIICAYLIGYYAFPGLIAAVAMMLYTLFTLTVLKFMGATFSLAAVAGLILSAAMAVDANILVFERMKEEIRNGRKLMTAIELGFKRAFSAILDSNVCTIITSLVLWTLGTSAVKGFATTLIVGVLISFFTALVVTRILLLGLLSLGIGTNEKWYALNRSLFGEKLERSSDGRVVPVIGKLKLWFGISVGLIIPGIIAIAMGGIKPNVEFQGGFEFDFAMPANVTEAQVRQSLEKAGYEGYNLKFAQVDSLKRVYITIPDGGKIKTGDPSAKQTVATDLGLPTEDAGLSSVGPTFQQETIRNAFLGILLSTSFIVIYLAVRFGFALGGMKNGLKFGLSAVAALLHDVLFVVGAAALVGLLLGWEISSLFITAMLTVIGFSVHDTIVVFDRIRENLRKASKGETFGHMVDRSVTQTIARSINTSFTAILTLTLLIFYGTPTPELKFMCLTMLLGIIIGTYSSIFNASPILYLWDKAVMKRKGESAGLIAEAHQEATLRASQVLASPAGSGMAAGTATGEPGSASQYGTIKRRRQARDTAAQPLDDE